MHLQKTISGLILFWVALQAGAQTVEQTIDASRQLSAKGQHAEAISTLQRARQTAPNDLSLQLAEARALAWAGQFESAQTLLDEALKQDRFNGDALLLQADLWFYQGHMAKAAESYRYLLTLYPDYEEARTGQQKALAALQPNEAAPSPTAARWSATMGAEYSWFDQTGRDPWRQTFVQIDRTRGSVSHYVKYAYYDQFRLNDNELEAGGAMVTQQGTSFQAALTLAPNSEFKARSRLFGGIETPLLRQTSGQPMWWAQAQLKREHYPDHSHATTFAPGTAVSLIPTLKLSGQVMVVDKSNESRATGRQFRLDHEWSDQFSWHVGYAKSPEVEQARVIRTRTWFVGAVAPLSPDHSIRIGYAHERREQQYIRQLVYASVTHRF